MKWLIDTHKKIWSQEFFWSVIAGVILFFLSLVVNYYAASYASERVSLPVTDVILSNIRAYDVDWIILYGALILIAFTVLVLIYQPKRIPFVLKSLALFIIIRSTFISLTHLGPFPTQITFDPSRLFNILSLNTTADLFFSGHTGIPFLLALIYWDRIALRWIFLATCVVFAVSVLLGHLHYSIDVFAAFFITYSIFAISQKIFREDWKLSRSR
ncbi:MAG: phosphatase PAP2-related protein [Candidatus Doudnabacteria bacterium]